MAAMALALLLLLLPCEAFESRAWRPSEPGFLEPELAEDSLAQHLNGKDFGVALAGGGARGMALGHGLLRSMREAGLLEQAKYLSVTSGSVWVGVPFYYQSLDSLEDFLGSSLPASQLLPEEVLRKTGTGISRLSYFREYPKGQEPKNKTRLLSSAGGIFDCPEDEGWCACAVSRFQPGSADFLWPLFMAYVFLHPFDLAGYGAIHCHESQLEKMRAKFGDSKTIYTARDVSRKLPFLLSQSAVLSPYTGVEGGEPLEFFPLEQTPLYVGTPQAFPKNQTTIGHAVGDLLVEPFAWDAPPKSWNNSKMEFQLEASRGWLNAGDLAQWAGIATSYIADFQIRTWADKIPRCVIAEAEKVLPQAKLWSPLDVDETSMPVSFKQAVGDAGIYDDLGHIPLLRRGISKMMIVTSEAIHLDLCEMTYVLAAFGQPGCLKPPNAAGASNPKMKAHTLTVFEPSEFPEFYERVLKARKSNETAVIRGRYSVVENKFFGIKGGWKVDIVWVIVFPSKTFRASLPSETSAMLPPYFPNDFASEMNSRLEMSVASQYASWLMQRSVLKEIRAMLEAEAVIV